MSPISTTEPYTVSLKAGRPRAPAGPLAMDAMRSPSERTLAVAAIGATADGTEAVTAVPLARAIATSKVASAKVETTAGHAAAVKSPAAGTTAATTGETAAAMTATTADAKTNRSSTIGQARLQGL